MSFEEAEEFKAKGNEKYKACEYAKAIELYKAVAALQPKEPVYPSNLSAAQFEDGKYSESLVWCDKALSLIELGPTASKALRIKLLTRRAKILVHLHAKDPTHFEEAKRACDSVIVDNPESELPRVQKEALERQQAPHAAANKVSQRLTDAPKYRRSMKPFLEYYTFGMDKVNSIFRIQYTNNDDPEVAHPFAERFHMRVPRDKTPFDFSALFCGVGDARHVYASLADIGLDLEERDMSEKEKVPPSVKIQINVIDVHPTALSRHLIVISLLHELSTIPKSQHYNNPRALELLLTLHYVYWGTTMPPLAHAILVETLTQVLSMIKEAADGDRAVDLNWLYIEPKTVRELLARLTWWKEKGQNVLSFDGILPDRIESDGPPEDEMVEMLINPEDRAAIKAQKNSRREQAISLMMDDPRVRQNVEIQAKEMGTTTEKVIQLMVEIFAEEFSKQENTPGNAQLERTAWKYLRVMVPPAHANEPKALRKIFEGIRSGDTNQLASPQNLKKAFAQIKRRWQSNFTLLDEDWLAANWGKSANVDSCPFKGVQYLFSEHYMNHMRPSGSKGGLYEWSAAFFSLVADGMRRLRECGSEALKLEIVHGDGFAIMDQIRMKTLTRNPTFPTTFDRIHTSNVPDYIGGYLSRFTTAVPLLKSHPASYYASCSLLNSGLWEGGFVNGDYALNLDSALHTFAGVTLAETPAAYGTSLCSLPAFAGNYHMFRRLEELPSRLNRDQLAKLAYACFIKTVLPAKYAKHTNPCSLREVLNIHAFFRLIENLKTLDYAPHILADIVEAILESRVNNSPRPHQVAPIPLASRKQPGVALCTTPFAAEFEVAAVMWEPKLFPICSKSMLAPDNIRRYSVRIEMARSMMEHTFPLTHFVLALVFGSPRDLDAGVMHLREHVVGKGDFCTSVQLVSTFNYDHSSHVATFFLSRTRAEQMIQSGYEIALLNTAFWRIQSNKVKCGKMQTVGDLDKWDKTREVAFSTGRELTGQEQQEWASVVMGGLYGGMPVPSW